MRHFGLLLVAGLMAIFCVLLVVWGIQDMMTREAQAKEVRKATRMCNAWADRLAVIKPNGEFKREYIGQLPETDPWGSSLVIEYVKVQRNSLVSMGIEHLRIVSLGPDKQRYTDDDIVVDRASRFGPGVMIDAP